MTKKKMFDENFASNIQFKMLILVVPKIVTGATVMTYLYCLICAV